MIMTTIILSKLAGTEKKNITSQGVLTVGTQFPGSRKPIVREVGLLRVSKLVQMLEPK